MISLRVLVILFASFLGATADNGYSFSLAVGGASGTSFATEGSGRITEVKLWEVTGQYIAGIQIRHGYLWSKRAGRTYGTVQHLKLMDGEVIVQISGKYHTNYIYQLMFVTSKGRFLTAGQPYKTSFNFYPKSENTELIKLSGRFNSAGITALAAHWGVVSSNSTSA